MHCLQVAEILSKKVGKRGRMASALHWVQRFLVISLGEVNKP